MQAGHYWKPMDILTMWILVKSEKQSTQIAFFAKIARMPVQKDATQWYVMKEGIVYVLVAEKSLLG